MSDRIDRERNMPSASTVSGVHLWSPDPVCTFYFAHPFGGIATPASTSYTINPFAGMPTNRTPSLSKSKNQCIHQHQHLKDFVPWPRQTLQSRDVLTPLIEALQQKIGQNIDEFEKVLRKIRELWYAPIPNTNIIDVQYLQNYYTFIQRQKQLNEQNFDYILNLREKSNVPFDVEYTMESNAFTTNKLIKTDNSRKIEKPMFDGTDRSAIMSHRKPYTRLLRRRHSLPEIIMRKHQLATQKNNLSNLNASTAPSPPARERVPASFELSREQTRTSSPISVSFTSSSSAIVANEYHTSTGSDSNLNRIYPSNGSMRQQLLRRLWHKEYRRFDRTGSLSPPLNRSLRSKRTFRIFENNSPDVCLECQKLEGENLNRSVPEITMKQMKHSNFSSIKTQSTATSVAYPYPWKSHSIETTTLNGNSIVSTDSSSNRTKSTQPMESNVLNGNSSPIIDTAGSVPRILNEINNSTISTSDRLNGNYKKSQISAENAFFIEMEGDRINVTTTENRLQSSSDDSSIQQHNQSIISRSKKHWHRNDMDDHTNNNNNPEHSRTKLNRMDNLNNNVNDSVDSMGSTYDAYYMNGDNNTENESSVRLITNESVDQSTLDTIISQILVDSLNNIIVVQGKVNQNGLLNESNVESNSNQTQTADNVSNASSSSSSLPLPTTTDQIYFPHYLSTETLSEYSTKLSNNSSAIELLPSNLVISVISGSSYPALDGGEMVVHRWTDIPRTESMEVQPSSAHTRRDEDKNENFEKIAAQETKETSAEDDAVSLVDSLDNPEEINDKIDLNVSMVGPKSASIERSQAFFIPMENAEKSNESAISASEHQSSGLEAVIANSLPSHLRERLERRQMEIYLRKKTELKQRQDKILKLIHQHKDTKSTSIANKETKTSFQIIPDESPIRSVKRLPDQSKAVLLKKNKSKQLRTEIGFLESYTVDAKGNLQFIEPDAKRNGSKKVTTVCGSVVKHHVATKKNITTKTTISPVKRVRESKIVANRAIDNRNKQITNPSLIRTKENSKKTEDIPKMTSIHHSPSDMITPDNDCGPRRMYQKTEICEGTKRIEILEIVECLNNSPNSLNPIESSTSRSLAERFSTKQSSKIPIPVPIKNRSCSRQSIVNATQQRSLRAQIRDSMHTGSKINIPKVDQIIADLLMEALSHSTDIGIEFIKTPQNPSSQSIIKMSNNSKRVNLSTRRTGNAITGNVNVGGGKRSAHSSAKYQQVFDAIPEEKSSSLSIDSPSEENSPTPWIDKKSKNSMVESTCRNCSSHAMKKTNDLMAEKEASTNGPKKVANGKAAIDSDNNKTAETWFGFFGRTHVESPIDSMLLDEESKDKKTDASSTGYNQFDSNEVVSMNVTTTESKISIVTSIPSEETGAKVTSVDSDSILPIIDETFETSVTGLHGGSATLEKPYRKNSGCSVQNHLGPHRPECDAIEKELQKSDQKQIAENGQTQEAKESKQEMNLQMATIDNCDAIEKNNNLSPISVYSAQNGTILAKTNTNSPLGSGIDCKSFIILHDENENAAHFLPNITSTASECSTTRNAYDQTKQSNTSFNRPCDDCCFCNSNLHQCRQDENGGESPKKCNYCSNRQQSNQTTPVNSSRFRIKNECVNNIDSGRSSTDPTDRIYERKYKSSHTHIQTHSRHSDTTNTRCTKKTNRLTRQSMHNGIDDTLNGNLRKTKLFGKTEEKSSNIEMNGSNKITTTNNDKKSSIPKLPPPTQNDWHSTETSPSSSSSFSTGSSNRSVRRQDSKSVPNLPRAERWPNIETNGNGNGMAKTRTNSRYQEFYGNNGIEQESTDSKSKPAGWTVTVAGTYTDDMAPDVQMHLIFPKRSSSQGNKQKIYRTIEHSKQRLIEQDVRSNSFKDEIYLDSQRMDKKPAILPLSNSIKLNPKRSLTKNNNIFGMDHLYHHQHQQIASNRDKFIYDTNGNANTLNQRSANKICNLPNVYQHRFNNNQTNRIIAKPTTTKKTIKRSEYSVSMASATTTTTTTTTTTATATTTRTISNFGNGKCATSYQTLNANTYQRFQNPNKSKGIPMRRDHSTAELGQSTYRVSVTPYSQQSSSYYMPTTFDLGDEMDSNGNPAKYLSVLGNAIAPERKPPVPTMSEHDVTRRHDACFTRTRSIFL